MKSVKYLSFFISALFLITGFISPAASDPIRAKITQATKHFRDISVTCTVQYGNERELAKIGRDFPKSYEFKTTTIEYKAPDKMRVEGRLGMINVALIVNGDTKAVHIPAVRYSKTENIKGEPHKRQTPIDMGILTGQHWQDYIVTRTAEENTPSGKFYRITYVRSNARNRNHIAWVEASTLKVTKAERHTEDGKLISRYIFSNHAKVNSIWVPRKADVYNRDNKLAGTTTYSDIKINSGVPDSRFKF